MDRAHRLGQKRVVNVHRLVMRGTLEEKVMSLQRFKISVANTIVNAENASLDKMDTGQLLDLFSMPGTGKVCLSRESLIALDLAFIYTPRFEKDFFLFNFVA